MPTADYEERVKRILNAMDKSDEIPDENAQLLKEYRRDKNLNGISDATLQRNLSYLKILGEWAGDTSFEDLGKSELKDFISETMDRDLADATVDTYKKAVRNFYKWLSGEDEPESVDWITLSNNGGNDTLPKDLLTKEDVQKQIEAAHNPRDKALIYMLYETGARIGELIDL
ncbi:MAG: tyrosine-type recombinase/integrase, partial [Halanaeroarchaeum sp.]